MTNNASTTQVTNPGKPAPRRALKTLAKVHVFLNKITGGWAFNRMEGTEVCFVHMTGAKSGREVVVPLIYVPYNNGALLVASQTGRDTNPVWYNNLVKNAEVTIRHRGKSKQLTAREAGGEEKEELWEVCDAVYADFAVYRARTKREIPIFVCQ